MKRRVIKKWVNRYISPIVKDMPEIKGRTLELYNPADPMQRYQSTGESIKVVNGKRVQEGQPSPKTRGMLKDMKSTAQELKRQIEGKSNLHNRMIIIRPGYGVYVRVISFEWPDGYVICEEDEQ